jgi:hypothetical protein
MLNSKWFRRCIVLVVGLGVVGLLFVNLLALHAGRVWIGRNYWGQPIDTWGQFIVLASLVGFGGYWLIRNWRWWL